MANKSPATASNSKKKNKVSKPKVQKEPLDETLESLKGSETKKLENSTPKETNTELPKTFKNNIEKLCVKWWLVMASNQKLALVPL